MSDAVKSIELQIKATNAASNVLKDVGRDVDGLRKKANAAGGLEGVFKNLRAGLGRRSTLGETAELFEGKGALIGLSRIGKELDESAKKIAEINHEWNSGTISSGQMVEKVAEGLPIFGQWITAGRTIRGILDGTAEATAREEEENKLVTAQLEFQIEHLRRSNIEHAKALATLRDIKNATALIGLPEPTRGLTAIAQHRAALEEDTDREIAEKKLAIEKEFGPKVQAARENQNKASAAAAAERDTNEDYDDPENRDDEELRQKETNLKYAAAIAGSIKKQQTAAEEAAEKEAHERKKADLAKLDAEEKELRRSSDAARQAEVRASERKISDIVAETEAQRLRAAGQGYAADQAELKRHLAEKQEDLVRAAAEEARTHPGDLVGIAGRTIRGLGANKTANDADQAKAAKEADAAAADVDAQLAAGRLKAIESELQAGNKSRAGEAEQLKIAQEYVERRKELVELSQRDKVTAAEKLEIEKQIADLSGEEKAAQAAAVKAHSADIDKSLDTAKEASLRQQAELGNRAADVELKRLQINKQHTEQAKALQDILNDRTASDAQKAQAQADLASLDASTQAALARAGAGGRTGTASLYTQSTLTGVSGPGGANPVDAAAKARAEAAAARAKAQVTLENINTNILKMNGNALENPFAYA